MSHSQHHHRYIYIIQYVGRSMASIYDLGSIFTSAPRVVYIGFRLRPLYRTIHITYIYIINIIIRREGGVDEENEEGNDKI